MWLSLANASPPFISYMVRNALPQKIQMGQFENVWVSYTAKAVGRDLGQSPYNVVFTRGIEGKSNMAFMCLAYNRRSFSTQEIAFNMGVASFEDRVSTLMAQFLFQLSFKSSIKHHRQPPIGCVSSKDLHQL
ncbi:hypothetical protein Peur_046709 [Populus x canadensis]